MATQDSCCSVVPYFKAHAGKLDAFKELCERFVEKSSGEPKCLYYGFSFDGDQIHCREGYSDAEGVLEQHGGFTQTFRPGGRDKFGVQCVEHPFLSQPRHSPGKVKSERKNR